MKNNLNIKKTDLSRIIHSSISTSSICRHSSLLRQLSISWSWCIMRRYWWWGNRWGCLCATIGWVALSGEGSCSTLYDAPDILRWSWRFCSRSLTMLGSSTALWTCGACSSGSLVCMLLNLEKINWIELTKNWRWFFLIKYISTQKTWSL